MKLYLYDGITKEYIETIEAYLDPAETALKGEPVYMYPANSTDIKPPLVGDNEIALFENDDWVITPDYRGFYQCNENFDVTPIDKFGELENGYVVITKEQADKITEDKLYYVIIDGELVVNPNYEQDKYNQERERIARLSLTRGDVFRGLLLAKGIIRSQIRELIENLPENTPDELITKELALIDFDEALNFYRGKEIIDVIGLRLGITSEQLDMFFETNDYTYLLEPTEE